MAVAGPTTPVAVVRSAGKRRSLMARMMPVLAAVIIMPLGTVAVVQYVLPKLAERKANQAAAAEASAQAKINARLNPKYHDLLEVPLTIDKLEYMRYRKEAGVAKGPKVLVKGTRYEAKADQIVVYYETDRRAGPNHFGLVHEGSFADIEDLVGSKRPTDSGTLDYQPVGLRPPRIATFEICMSIDFSDPAAELWNDKQEEMIAETARLLAAKQFNDLLEPGFRKLLRDELRVKYNSILGSDIVDSVIIVSIVTK